MYETAFSPFQPFFDWFALMAGLDVDDDTPDLTGAPWQLSGTDSDGTNWCGTEITFVKQQPHGDDYVITGVIDWHSDQGDHARELFAGTLTADRELHIQGFDFESPSEEFVLGVYRARLNEDGSAIVDGAWDGSGAVATSESWSARRERVTSRAPAAALAAGPFALPLMMASMFGVMLGKTGEAMWSDWPGLADPMGLITSRH